MDSSILRSEIKELLIDPESLRSYLSLPLTFDTSDSSGSQIVLAECWYRYINGVLHPDYNFHEIAERMNISKQHQNNLLAIVTEMFEYSWKSATNFAYDILRKDKAASFVDLSAEGINRLEDLHKLLVIKESYIDGLEILINPKDLIKTDTGIEERSPLIKEYQLNIMHDSSLKSRIIGHLITLTLQELALPFFSDIYRQIPQWKDLTANNINELILSLKPKFTEKELRHRFTKKICETVREYLSNESRTAEQDINLLQSEGVLIYSLLLLFNMITPKQHKKHFTDQKKTNYISTFFKKDIISKKRIFPTPK